MVMRQHMFILFACCIVWRGLSTYNKYLARTNLFLYYLFPGQNSEEYSNYIYSTGNRIHVMMVIMMIMANIMP
jgi:hypothetical protein